MVLQSSFSDFVICLVFCLLPYYARFWEYIRFPTFVYMLHKYFVGKGRVRVMVSFPLYCHWYHVELYFSTSGSRPVGNLWRVLSIRVNVFAQVVADFYPGLDEAPLRALKYPDPPSPLYRPTWSIQVVINHYVMLARKDFYFYRHRIKESPLRVDIYIVFWLTILGWSTLLLLYIFVVVVHFCSFLFWKHIRKKHGFWTVEWS